MLLPPVASRADYEPLYGDREVWLPAMRVICARHALDPETLAPGHPGTHVVFHAGRDRVVKLYAPPWPDDFQRERAVLERLSAHPGLGAPQCLAEGQLEGWPYLVMTSVHGLRLGDAWPSLDQHEREQVARRCGEWLAALHEVPTAGLEPLSIDWPAFAAERARLCLAEQRAAGPHEGWLRAVADLLADLPPLYEPGFLPVVLHADLTEENVFVGCFGGRWKITGVIDYGDAMLGHPHYDLACPGCFVTRGSIARQRALLLTFGLPEATLDADLARRLLAYTLLHRYIRLADLVGGAAPGPRPLEALQRELWGFGSDARGGRGR